MPYGEKWRRHRRVFHQSFTERESLTYRPTQTQKVQDMLHGLLSTPENFMEHIKTQVH